MSLRVTAANAHTLTGEAERYFEGAKSSIGQKKSGPSGAAFQVLLTCFLRSGDPYEVAIASGRRIIEEAHTEGLIWLRSREESQAIRCGSHRK